MERFAEVVLRHRGAVVLLWLVLLVAGVAAAGRLSDRLSFDFSLPGQPGYETEQKLIATYHVSSDDTLVPVLTVPEGETIQGHRADVAAVFDTVRMQLPRLRVVDLASAGDAMFVFDGGRRTFALVQGAPPTGFGAGTEVALAPVLQQAAAAHGLQTGLTSYALLSAGGTSGGPSVLVETLLGALGGLVVLIFVFASFLALVPLAIAAISILTTFLLVLGLTVLTPVSFIVQFLISLVGLGVAIDYSLLLISRWREERAHGHDNREAVVIAMRTAGRAVLASGVTVGISLLALLVVPVPFLRSMGLGGLLIPLVSVAAVLTLLPALLSSIGPRLDWPRIRHEGIASRGWSAWARAIVRRRWLAAGAALVVLGLLIAPVFGLRIGQSGVDSLASSGPAFDTVTQLRQGGVGAGVLTPIEVLVPAGKAQVAVVAARGVAGVRTAVVGGTRGDSALVDVFPRTETVDSDGNAVVEAVRSAVRTATGTDVGVTGSGAAVQDYSSAIYNNFPYMLLLIAVITFVLLARTFRSVLLPLKAVLLNLVSLAAVFGSVVFFWQQGHGAQTVFGVAPTGAITFWLPVMIFAFLFGLSMDYEVFILARMREEYDATGSTSAAVVGGLGRTGRLVTSAALILFCSFAALASAPGTDVKVLGTALGAGILIDATVVRALLVPALVSLFGQWNWWLPTRLAMLLRVEPSPLAPSRPDVTDTAGDTDMPVSGAVGRHRLVGATVTSIGPAHDSQLAVCGAIRRNDGCPLAGMPVTVIDTAGRQIAVVRTGTDGSYLLTVPTGGDYLLVASANGYHPAAFLVTVTDRPVRREIVLPALESAAGPARGTHARRPPGPVGRSGARSASLPGLGLIATALLILPATFYLWPTSTNGSTTRSAAPITAPTTQPVVTPSPSPVAPRQDDTPVVDAADQPNQQASLGVSSPSRSGVAADNYNRPAGLSQARGHHNTAGIPASVPRTPHPDSSPPVRSTPATPVTTVEPPAPPPQQTAAKSAVQPAPSVSPTPTPAPAPAPAPTGTSTVRELGGFASIHDLCIALGYDEANVAGGALVCWGNADRSPSTLRLSDQYRAAR